MATQELGNFHKGYKIAKAQGAKKSRRLTNVFYTRDSDSWKSITSMHDDYFLVNVVENDFVNGDIYKLFPCFKSR